MTAITLGTGGSLPSTANEISSAFIWAASKLQIIQPKKQYILFDNFPPQPVVDLRVFPTVGYGTRASVQVILEIKSDWQTSTGKFWQKGKGVPIDENSPQNASEAFTPGTGGSIPSTVTSLSGLILWLAEAARRCNPTALVIETASVGFIPVADNRLGDTTEHGTLSISRLSLPLDPNYASKTGDFWANALPLNYVSLPTDLLT